MNRTHLESARSMMVHPGLLDKFWAKSVECVAYIRNHTPTAIKCKKTPLEFWSGKKPDILHLKVFGCIPYTHVPDAQRQNLRRRQRNCDSLATLFFPSATDCLMWRLLAENYILTEKTEYVQTKEKQRNTRSHEKLHNSYIITDTN